MTNVMGDAMLNAARATWRGAAVRMASFFAALFLISGGAVAQQIGMPIPDQLDLQPPATPVAEDVLALHHWMLYIITGITVFVLALLVIVIVRYNAAVNKTPARWTHNSLIEIIWTVVPVVILIVIAIPSVRLLQLQEDFSKVEPDVVVKATGWQWFWEYSYPDHEIEFTSSMIGLGEPVRTAAVEAELAAAGYTPETWKLATDTAMVVPVGKTVLVQVTAQDVIHSWTVPSFAVKADGVPGRLNQTWFRANEVGIYFGQCSELCGRDHAYMPITVKVVTQQEYDQWVACVQDSSVEECETPRMDEMLAEAAQKGVDAVETASAAQVEQGGQ